MTLTETRNLQVGDRIRVHLDSAGRLQPISMMMGHVPNHIATITSPSLPTSIGGSYVYVDGVGLHFEGRAILADDE